jgi:toxin YoeB
MRLVFSQAAWDDYLHWQKRDRRALERINALVKECLHTPLIGRGKPEPLRGELSGWWSRRIDLEHRLVYRVEGDALLIAQFRYHY